MGLAIVDRFSPLSPSTTIGGSSSSLSADSFIQHWGYSNLLNVQPVLAFEYSKYWMSRVVNN